MSERPGRDPTPQGGLAGANAKEEELTYQPRPIDTSDVMLPEDLTDLIERLAESIHDTWAAQRIAEGWTYGPRRDDEARQHPDLVPYSELPESEKAYDRNTVTGTLKAFVALGYRIEPPDSAPSE
jgi:hypothetical protein